MMFNLAKSYSTSLENVYLYSSVDLSRDVMTPLIHIIRDYDPDFRKHYQELSEQLPQVLTGNSLAITQFTERLNSIKDKISRIKNLSILTRSQLATIRDDLAQSIRNTKTTLDELTAQKEGLNGQKQVIEKQISAKKAEIDGYMTAFWIFSWIIALILESIKPFDAALNEIKDKLAENQREIENLDSNEKNTQQLLDDAIDLFNSNQRLSTSCDVMQGNINNIQDSLKRLDLESHFLKAKLVTLEKDWSGLINIVNTN
jgi:chromosome segregation ATPase